MITIYAKNVREALPQGLRLLRDIGKEEPSRAGPVLVAPCPVVTVYAEPCARVLLSAERDANPFFHLAEALWMLAGREDAAFLNKFIPDFTNRFAESDGRMHGAYGFRWRRHFMKDQIKAVIQVLQQEKTSRQALLTMWNPNVDLAIPGLKDRPCNTQIYLRIQENALDMTVTCRSNDILWGAYGSNAVHFSILQEYLAAWLQVKVGIYYQFSNNFHAYVNELAKHKGHMMFDIREVVALPLVNNIFSFDSELTQLLLNSIQPTENEFLAQTAYPMLMAHTCWRIKEYKTCLEWLRDIASPDWRLACTEWCERRLVRRNIDVLAS